MAEEVTRCRSSFSLWFEEYLLEAGIKYKKVKNNEHRHMPMYEHQMLIPTLTSA